MNAPDWFRQKTPIFHITSIENLENILKSKSIFSKNEISRQDIRYINVANNEIQENRSVYNLPNGKNLHDYVPFSFAPLTPMLNAIHKGSIPGCTAKQEDMIYIVTDAQYVGGNSSVNYIFTDVHPLSKPVKIFTSLKSFEDIDWEIFFDNPHITGGYCKFWLDKNDPNHPKWFGRKRKRMAEFLILNSMPIHFIKHFAVINQETYNKLHTLLTQYNLNREIRIIRDWYY